MTDIEVWEAYKKSRDRREWNYVSVLDACAELSLSISSLNDYGEVEKVTRRLVSRGLLKPVIGYDHIYDPVDLMTEMAILSND